MTQITLVDLYRDKPLTDAQVRRIVALLGLANGGARKNGAEVPASTPLIENTRQRAS